MQALVCTTERVEAIFKEKGVSAQTFFTPYLNQVKKHKIKYFFN